MTEAQQKWVDKRILELKSTIERKWPLSQSDWNSLADTIAKIVDMAKGNAEVRRALFDFIEPYQKKAEEEMKGNRHE